MGNSSFLLHTRGQPMQSTCWGMPLQDRCACWNIYVHLSVDGVALVHMLVTLCCACRMRVQATAAAAAMRAQLRSQHAPHSRAPDKLDLARRGSPDHLLANGQGGAAPLEPAPAGAPFAERSPAEHYDHGDPAGQHRSSHFAAREERAQRRSEAVEKYQTALSTVKPEDDSTRHRRPGMEWHSSDLSAAGSQLQAPVSGRKEAARVSAVASRSGRGSGSSTNNGSGSSSGTEGTAMQQRSGSTGSATHTGTGSDDTDGSRSASGAGSDSGSGSRNRSGSVSGSGSDSESDVSGSVVSDNSSD